MKLRPYQLDLIQEIRNKLSQGKKRVILCAPTGAGKTIIFTSVVLDTLTKDMFNRVLIITDRIELFKQTFKALESKGVNPEIYSAKVKRGQNVRGRCVVGMVETIKRRSETVVNDIGNFNLIIIDEAHKGNFSKIFDIWPKSYYIGATATPLATKKESPLKSMYDDIAFVVDVHDLIEQGFLMPALHLQMVGLYDEADLDYDYKTGDFSNKSLQAAFSTPKLYEGLMSAYNEHGRGKKTIIFCVNINEAINVSNMIEGSFCIHSKTTKDERDRQINGFHDSDNGVMVNCGILTTGYDHPPIEVVIMNRATASLPLWLQCCGRGSRISPGTGKEFFTIIDMGGNIKRLSLWDASRDWVDWFFNPPKKGIGKPAPTRECQSCQAMLPARQLICNFCGAQIKAKPVEKLVGELEVVSDVPSEFKNRYIGDLSVHELYILQKKSTKYKPSFIWRVVRSKGRVALKEYQKMAGYKQGWYLKQREEEIGFYNIKLI